MDDPPFEPEGVKEMVASALPAVAEADVGADGTVTGVEETMFEGVEVPTLFWARTSKSYDWPFVSEVTVDVVCKEVVVA
jgi:hypothetical protein